MIKRSMKSVIAMLVLGVFTSCQIIAQNNQREERKRPSLEELFKEMDKNEDGMLSKKEVKGPLKNDFDNIDANEDGLLSMEELENAPKPERRARPNRNK